MDGVRRGAARDRGRDDQEHQHASSHVLFLSRQRRQRLVDCAGPLSRLAAVKSTARAVRKTIRQMPHGGLRLLPCVHASAVRRRERRVIDKYDEKGPTNRVFVGRDFLAFRAGNAEVYTMNGKAKWVGVSWMVVALLPLLAGIAGAVNPTMPQTNQPNQQDEQVATSPSPNQPTAGVQPKLDKAKDLIGAKIVNDKGERLGTVADIVLTPDRDAISYVVLSHGGTWGMGEKYFAVPWSQFGFQAGRRKARRTRLLVLKNVDGRISTRPRASTRIIGRRVANENWLGIGQCPRNPAQTPSESCRAVARLSRGYRCQRGSRAFHSPPSPDEYANPAGRDARASGSRSDESAQATHRTWDRARTRRIRRTGERVRQASLSESIN